MSTLEVNSLIHLDASSNNLDLDSSGNATVNGNMTATQFYGGGGNLTGVGVDGIVSTANATAITIDSSENVGIGTSSPASARGIQGPVLHVSGTPDAAIRITDTGGSDFEISAETNTTITTVDATDLIFGTNNSEKLRIQSSGRIGIGTTSPAANFNISNGTVSVRSLEVESSGSNNESVGVFKTSNAGFNDTILMAQNLNGTGGSLLKLQAGGSTVLEVKSTGGILFNGDTAAANALDDYEEGSWTPVITASSGTINSYVIGGAHYTKIGRLCTINLYYYVTSNGTGSGYSKFTLPFTASSLAGYRATGGGNEIGHTGWGIIGTINAGATYGRIYVSKDGSYPINGGYNQMTISYIPA